MIGQQHTALHDLLRYIYIMYRKGDSRIFLWRFLNSLHSKAAIGSFLLGGSGGMLPQENLENWGTVYFLITAPKKNNLRHRLALKLE